jgi:hypothetical protein
MAAEFRIPAKPDDILEEDCEFDVKVCRFTDVGSLSQGDIDDFVEG